MDARAWRSFPRSRRWRSATCTRRGHRRDPVLRKRELARMRARESGAQVYWRESNTLTSTVYRRDPATRCSCSSPMTWWPRGRYMGAANTLVGLGASRRRPRDVSLRRRRRCFAAAFAASCGASPSSCSKTSARARSTTPAHPSRSPRRPATPIDVPRQPRACEQFPVRAPASPAQPIPGGGSEGAVEAPFDQGSWGEARRGPSRPPSTKVPGGGSEGAVEAPFDQGSWGRLGGGRRGPLRPRFLGEARRGPSRPPSTKVPGGGSEGAVEAPFDQGSWGEARRGPSRPPSS